MTGSILESIKKRLFLPLEDTTFDDDVIMDINTAFFSLGQLGVGEAEYFRISGKDNVWEEFSTRPDIESTKDYVYYKVKLSFDPPQQTNLIEVFNKNISELEWRLAVQVDPVEGGN